MSNYGRLVAETTDQYLAALDAVQQNVVKSFAAFSASLPTSPMSSQLAMPGLPTVQEGMAVSFSFAQKLLNQQQSFMQKVVATTPPEVPVAPAVAFGKVVSPKSKNAN